MVSLWPMCSMFYYFLPPVCLCYLGCSFSSFLHNAVKLFMWALSSFLMNVCRAMNIPLNTACTVPNKSCWLTSFSFVSRNLLIPLWFPLRLIGYVLRNLSWLESSWLKSFVNCYSASKIFQYFILSITFSLLTFLFVFFSFLFLISLAVHSIASLSLLSILIIFTLKSISNSLYRGLLWNGSTGLQSLSTMFGGFMHWCTLIV